MSRQVLTLEADRFTRISELAREIEALLMRSDYKLDVVIDAKDLEHLNEELDGRRTMGRVAVRTLKQKANGNKIRSSHHWEIVDDTYKKYPDGRLEALKTRKGREWYREQVLIMVARQNLICGLEEYRECKLAGRVMVYVGPEESRPTFEHWDKRGAGKRNDSIDPKTKNCAVHAICNRELGSRRIGE